MFVAILNCVASNYAIASKTSNVFDAANSDYYFHCTYLLVVHCLVFCGITSEYVC
jgi:hypothetical protein